MTTTWQNATENGNESAATRDLQDRLRATKFVLGVRERELLELKGPCSNKACALHFAHSGPC